MNGLGVCGILRPCGTFVECGRGKHHTIVGGIPFSEESQLIFFSSKMDGVSGVVYKQCLTSMILPVAEEQVEWMKQNYAKFDDTQAMFVDHWIYIMGNMKSKNKKCVTKYVAI